VFFGTLAVVLGILVLVAAFYKTLLESWRIVLSAIGLVLLALIWRGFREMRARRLNRYKSSPLSRDEKVKARSKLKTNSTFKFKS
jgi:membrane protein implicated in regulation of membrane protease activity